MANIQVTIMDRGPISPEKAKTVAFFRSPETVREAIWPPAASEATSAAFLSI